ncbi:MAG: hypothetical protein M3Y87_18065 [Myxococcota bacterium]|nr:hypothetical protein [Myxococcota bacterium]
MRDRLRTSLEARGAEVVIAPDDASASHAIGGGGIAGMIVELDPSPRASGLGVLLAARERIPSARRVLVVEGRASIADAAIAAGLADRLLIDSANERRIDAIADWLVTLCDHAPRRGSIGALA